VKTIQPFSELSEWRAAFAAHTNPLWAESAVQAQEWGQVAEARASEVAVQAQENPEGQNLHGEGGMGVT
jgi:hypothetical protein